VSNCPRSPTLDNVPPSDEPTPPDPAASAPPPRSEPPGLREQVKATIDAGRGMIDAHIGLARAEFEEIGDEVKRVAALGGVAAGILVFLGFFFPIGLLLFLGEWLFGSIGWGVLLYTELGVAVALTAVIIALGVPGSKVGPAITIGIVVAVVLGLVLGLALTNEGWTRLGASVLPGVEVGFRPLGTAMAFSAAVVGIIGLVFGARAGGLGGAIGGLIAGAILGVVIGALSAIRFGPGPGVALGIAVGGIVWIALVARAVMQVGVDGDKLKARFWPSQTIETTKETIEWVRERTPLGPRP
jgi:MFS family permease